MRKLLVVLSALAVAALPLIAVSPAQAAAYSISVSSSNTIITKGQQITLSGVIKPGTANKEVIIQRLKSGTWVNLTKTTTVSGGHFSKLILPSGPATVSYRVKTAAKGSYSAGTSNTVNVAVYAWLDLAELTKVYDVSDRYVNRTDSGFGDEFGPLTQDGNESWDDAWLNNDVTDGFGYGKSIWDLNGKCNKVRGRAGIDDSSDLGAIGRFKILFDGTGDYYRLFDGGDSEYVTLTINKTDKLTIVSERVNPDESTIVGFGEPEVLCKAFLPRDTPYVE